MHMMRAYVLVALAVTLTLTAVAATQEHAQESSRDNNNQQPALENNNNQQQSGTAIAGSIGESEDAAGVGQTSAAEPEESDTAWATSMLYFSAADPTDDLRLKEVSAGHSELLRSIVAAASKPAGAVEDVEPDSNGIKWRTADQTHAMIQEATGRTDHPRDNDWLREVMRRIDGIIEHARVGDNDSHSYSHDTAPVSCDIPDYTWDSRSDIAAVEYLKETLGYKLDWDMRRKQRVVVW